MEVPAPRVAHSRPSQSPIETYSCGGPRNSQTAAPFVRTEVRPMKLSTIVNTVVLTAAVAGAAAPARAGTTVKAVRADVVATATDGTTSGYVRLVDVEHDGTAFQGLFVYVKGLDAGGAASPAFEVVL